MGKFLGYFLTGLLSALGWDLIFTGVAFAQDGAGSANPLFFVFSILFYLYFSFTLQVIAQKRNVPNAWLAWIPLANIWVFIKCADRPDWWLLLFLIPIVNVIAALILIFDLPPKLGKTPLLGLLIFIPGLGVLLYYGILAFT